MTDRDAVRAAYDAVAEPYGTRFRDEIDGKHLEIEYGGKRAHFVLRKPDAGPA